MPRHLPREERAFAAFDANGFLKVSRASAASNQIITSRLSGDSFDRFVIRADGGLSWGDGTVATDISLSRAQSGLLTVDKNLQAGTLFAGNYFVTAAGRLKARLLPPPRAVSRSGRLLGTSPLNGQEIRLDTVAATQHLHILGPTGTGKSTLLVNLMLQDINRGESVDSFGPRTSDVLHSGLLTLARSRGSSLATLPLLLTDARYRRQLLGRLDDPLGIEPFWAWYDSLSDPERRQVIAPTMNKIRPFLLRPALRAVIGQAAPRFDLQDVFTKRRVVLVNLAKGGLGPEGSALLGTLLLNQLWQTALTRSSLTPERLRPVNLYVDEIQDFLRLPGDVGDILAQARSLQVAFTLAHQHLGQLSSELQTAVLSNARSRVLFQLSAGDAATLTRGQTLLTASDVTALPAYEAYVRLVAPDRSVTPYFSAVTAPPAAASADPAALRRHSAQRFGVSAAETEAGLRALLQPPGGQAFGDIGQRPRRRT